MKCEKCGGVFPNRKGRFCGTCNWNHPQFVYGESNTMEDFDRRSADVAEMRKELLTHKREGKKIDSPFVVPSRGKYARPTMSEFFGPNHEEQIESLQQKCKMMQEAIERIANTPDDYEMEYCRDIAIKTLEELI